MKGFTLIEFMILIAIIGILFAVGVGAIKGVDTSPQTVEMENCVQVDTPTKKYWDCDR